MGRSRRDRAAPGEERRAHHRRLPAKHGSRRMTDIPPFYEKLIRIVKAPIMIDTTDPQGHRTGADLLPGQEHHQLDQSGRRRREVRARLPAGQGLWSGPGGRHHRRRQAAGAGLHARTQTGRGAAIGRPADHQIRHCARRHHHRSAGFPLRHGRHQLHRRRGRNHRGACA